MTFILQVILYIMIGWAVGFYLAKDHEIDFEGTMAIIVVTLFWPLVFFIMLLGFPVILIKKYQERKNDTK